MLALLLALALAATTARQPARDAAQAAARAPGLRPGGPGDRGARLPRRRRRRRAGGRARCWSCTGARSRPGAARSTWSPRTTPPAPAAGPVPGDTARLPPRAGPEVKVVTLPPLPSDEELARRGAQVAAAPVPLVESKAVPASTRPLEAPRGGFGEFAFSDVTWWSSDLGTYHADRVDAALHGAPVGPFTADVDLRAEYWSSQPAGAVFLPADKARFLVWQAQLTWAPEARPFSISAGRVLAWNVPGATSMDGAMVTWRRGGLSGGLLGGLVPQPDTTSPTTTRATAGGFWGWQGKLGSDVMVRQEGRLALVRSPELGDRRRAAGGRLGPRRRLARSLRRCPLRVRGDGALAGRARRRAGGGGRPARCRASRSPAPSTTASCSTRSPSRRWPGRGAPATPMATSPGTSARSAPGVSGGMAHDLVSDLDRAWVGPELSVPRFFTPRVSLSAGYLEELGWLDGRSAWLQAVARPWDPVRLIARLSWGYQANLGTRAERLRPLPLRLHRADPPPRAAALGADAGRGRRQRRRTRSRSASTRWPRSTRSTDRGGGAGPVQPPGPPLASGRAMRSRPAAVPAPGRLRSVRGAVPWPARGPARPGPAWSAGTSTTSSTRWPIPARSTRPCRPRRSRPGSTPWRPCWSGSTPTWCCCRRWSGGRSCSAWRHGPATRRPGCWRGTTPAASTWPSSRGGR